MASILQKVYLSMGRWLKLLPDPASGSILPAAARPWHSLDPYDRTRILRAYYDNADLYALVQTGLESRASVKHPLLATRNPTYQVVEFYVTNLWRGQLPDALQIETSNLALLDPIHQVWRWSNWATRKQKAARWLARDGDLFLKVAQNEAGSRVFFQLIDALHVTAFEKDLRDNVTSIRLDIPQAKIEGGRTRLEWLTEVWEAKVNGGRGRYRRWQHDRGRAAELSKLPGPLEDVSLSEEFGLDFVPFVHAPFLDVGEPRGRSAVEVALDAIDEANRKATRLSKQQFRHNDVTWAVESDATDRLGRPLPPPSLEGESGGTEEIVELGGERFLKLPSGWHLTATVPSLDYASALAVLQDDMHELERSLPEMTWFRIRDQELSGRAIRLKLGEAIARAEEVQGNALDALVRANQMALTMGQQAGLGGFEVETIGTFEAGDFEHAIAPPEILPVPRGERAETLRQFTDAGLPVGAAMRLAGYGQAEIAEVEAELAMERQRQADTQAQLTLQALRDAQAFQGAGTGSDEEDEQPTNEEQG